MDSKKVREMCVYLVKTTDIDYPDFIEDPVAVAFLRRHEMDDIYQFQEVTREALTEFISLL